MSQQPVLTQTKKPFGKLRDVPIAGKLLILVLIPLAIASIAALVLIISGLNRLESETSVAQLQDEVQIIRKEFAQLQSDLTVDAGILAAEPTVPQAIGNNDRAALQSLLLSNSIRTHLDYLQIVNRDGQVLSEIQNFAPGDAKAELERLSNLGLLEIETTRLVLTPQGWLLTNVRPLKTQTGLIGALSTGRLLDASTLYDLNFERTDPLLALFDTQGNINVIASPDDQNNLSTSLKVDPDLWTQAGQEQIALGQTDVQGKLQRVAYAPLKIGETTAIFELALSTEAATRLRDQTILTALLVVSGLVLLTIVSAVAFGRSFIVRPIAALVTGVKQVTAGQLEVVVPGGASRDEIGVLANSFNQMTAQLHDLVRSLKLGTQLLQTSAEVGRTAVSVLDTEQLMREVVDLITERFGFYYAAFFLADPAQQWAVLHEATGEAGRILKDRNHRLEINYQSMVGAAMITRRSRIALDVGTEAARFDNPLLPETRSEIALPLVVADRVLGALDVQSTETGTFDEASAVMLQSMADQIAIALNNANQFRQTELALQRTNLLYVTTQSLAEAKSTDEILSAIVACIGAEANRSDLYTYGPRHDNGELEYVELAAAWSHPDDVQGMQPISAGTRFTPEQMPLVHLITSDQPLTVSDIQAQDVSAPLRGLMQRFGATALIGLPLIAGKMPLGILAIGYYTAQRFDADQLQLLTTLARQIAIVLQNQQSLQASQATLEQLDRLNRRLIGEAWQEYTTAASGGMRKVKMGYGMSPEATQTPMPSSVAAPVVVDGVEIGALSLEDAAADRAWTPTEVLLLQSVASEVSIALEKARLTEQTEQRAQREARLNQIAQQLRQATNINSILQTAAEQLSLALDTSHAQAQLGTSRTTPRQLNSHQGGSAED
jgi:GAF domain-containing protein/HAMP domain-containing protein